MAFRARVKASVLPAAPLRDHFLAASLKIDSCLRERLLVLPVLEFSGGADISQADLPCSVESLRRLLELQPQIWQEPDSNHLLGHCSRHGLSAVQKHFQPDQQEVAISATEDSSPGHVLQDESLAELPLARAAVGSQRRLLKPILPASVLASFMVKCSGMSNVHGKIPCLS